jgi:hypothetical protein
MDDDTTKPSIVKPKRRTKQRKKRLNDFIANKESSIQKEAVKKRDTSHLKAWRWEKGMKSPNPLGRPKKLSFTEVLTYVLEQPEPGDTQKRSRIELLAQAIWADAYNGNADMRHAIWDRLDGKVQERIAVDASHSFDKPPIEVASEEAKVTDPYAPEQLGKIFDTFREIGLIPEEEAALVAVGDAPATQNDEVHAEDADAQAANLPKTE